MQKILFVCLGNICRSPLAEGIMLHLKKIHQIPHHFDSAGTAGYHVGEAPDPRTIANAKKNGVDLSQLRARQVKKEDLDHFDVIYVMDKSNLQNVKKLASTEAHHQKIKLFLELLESDPRMEVPDPYYCSEEVFEEVFQLVYKNCQVLLSKLN